ncbi:hypothetical protein LINGRAHAP2_LOCUS29700 [Linum grandiflorum]
MDRWIEVGVTQLRDMFFEIILAWSSEFLLPNSGVCTITRAEMRGVLDGL